MIYVLYLTRGQVKIDKLNIDKINNEKTNKQTI